MYKMDGKHLNYAGSQYFADKLYKGLNNTNFLIMESMEIH